MEEDLYVILKRKDFVESCIKVVTVTFNWYIHVFGDVPDSDVEDRDFFAQCTRSALDFC